MAERGPELWALILAGGDGVRLRALTQRIAGDGRPKQFCPLIADETLLDLTRRRVELVVRPDRQVIVVTREHAPYFTDLARDLLPGRLVVQPLNQGTAAGIVYPLLRTMELAGDVPVAIFPCDHEVREDRAFAGYVERAAAVVRALPGHVVLLGMEAESPETEYGWIEPGARPLALDGLPVFPIRRFVEKPGPPQAEALHARRCLWNSFVMVGRAGDFLDLVQEALPDLMAAFGPLRRALGTAEEARVAERVYADLWALSFSSHVLSRVPERLLAVRVKDVGWSDLGSPRRVAAALRRRGWRPPWLGALELAATA